MSSSKKQALGKGFESLVPISVQVNNVTAQKNERIHKLSIDTVIPKDGQPRKSFDESALDQLALSIKEQGILQPIIVAQTEQNKYSIIAGERRWRAAKLAGLSELPAIIREVNEHEHLELSLLENVQRSDLNPLELAQTIYRLHTDFNQSYEDIAIRLGKGYTTVVNSVRLLGLPDVMQDSLINGTITEGHARSLLSLNKYPVEQNNLYTQILTKQLSVRQAEQFVYDFKNGRIKIKQNNLSTNIDLNKQAAKISKVIGYKVKISQTKNGKGKLLINYKNQQQLEAIVQLLTKN